MTIEEFDILQLLRKSIWERYKPGIPFEKIGSESANLAIEITVVTGMPVTAKTVRRFFKLDLDSSIRENRSKGIFAMYALGIYGTGLPYTKYNGYYYEFIRNVFNAKNQTVEVNPTIQEKPIIPNAEFLAYLAGTYESYIISNREQKIRKSIVVIRSDGTINCKSSAPFEYHGNIEIKARGQILVLNFKAKNLDSNDFFQTILHGRYDIGVTNFYGVFSGVSIHNFPMGGRELFIKVGKEEDYEQLIPCTIKIKDPAFKELVRDVPELVDFFTGQRDTFIDTKAMMDLIERNAAQ